MSDSNTNAPNSEVRAQYGPLIGNTILTPPRTGAAQATSKISAYAVGTNSTIGTDFQAFLVEVANTLIALGVWKGSA